MLGGRGDGGGGAVSKGADSGANVAAASARTCDHDNGSCVAGVRFEVDVGLGQGDGNKCCKCGGGGAARVSAYRFLVVLRGGDWLGHITNLQ